MRAARHCFVCGSENPIGLRLQFTHHGEGVRAEFTPSPVHVGYDGIVHGGIIAALIDDAMANIWFVRGEEALTAKLEIRFRQAAEPGERLVVSAYPTGKHGALVTARAEVCLTDGAVVAEGTGFLAVRAPA